MNKSKINLAIKVAERNKTIAQENLTKANTDLHILYLLRQEKKQKGFIDLFLNGKTFYGERK
tara:strand:+ start:139 stop:324 length:186 start_codon:yes stop_codon:yes gene_type:complete